MIKYRLCRAPPMVDVDEEVSSCAVSQCPPMVMMQLAEFYLLEEQEFCELESKFD